MPAFADGLRPHLHRGVGVERVAFGIDVLGLELLDDGLGGRLVARIGTEGEQRAFAGGPGDRGELLVGQRIAGHQHRLQALVAHLAQDQAGFLMIAADIDQIDVVALQARHDGVKILVALVVGFEHLLGDAGLVERLLGLVGETFAVGGLVVEDGDVLALVVLDDVFGGDQALLVVAAADARHVPQLAFGEQRIGRGRRDLQHVAVGIGFRRRDRRRRAIMTGDERDFRAGDLFRHRARLLRIAGVVLDIQRQFLAEHAAGGVEILHRLFGAVLHLPAECGFAARHRARHGDGDVLCKRRRRQRQRRAQCQADEFQ